MTGIDPYEVMKCRNQVSEFIEPYKNEVSENNPLILQIKSVDEVINRFFRKEVLDYTKPVRNIVILGKCIESIKDIPIVSPDGSQIRDSHQEIYGRRLLKERDPWGIIYELEVAYDCFSEGLETQLVHEGNKKGPDIFLHCDSTCISIECKSRRSKTQNNTNNLHEKIIEEIYDQTNIGEHSYYIEICGNKKLNGKHKNDIIELACEVIEGNKNQESIEINDSEFIVEIIDEFKGIKNSDLKKEDIERWMKYDILPVDSIQDFVSPFDVGLNDPRISSRGMIKFNSDGTTVCKSHLAIEFKYPKIDKDYYDNVMNTIDKGISDLSGKSPSVLFIHMPAYETKDMIRSEIQEGDFDPILQIKRLEQRINGKLKISDSVNAVLFNVTHFSVEGNECHIQRSYKTFKNGSVEDSLPSEFWNVFPKSDS